MTTFHFIRHEESEANVQAKLAHESGALRLDLPWYSSYDIPLSPAGFQRAKSLKCPPAQWVYCSPYKRAKQTMLLSIPGSMSYREDGRLVDKHQGVFDRLSVEGMKVYHPDEWAKRLKLGKFYHRPFGGESWEDVARRIKSFMDDVVQIGWDTVLVFTHDVPILTAIYICGKMTPNEILGYQKRTPVKNGSITTLIYEGEDDASRARQDTVGASR